MAKCQTCINKKSGQKISPKEYYVAIRQDGKILFWHLRCFLLYRKNFNNLFNS